MRINGCWLDRRVPTSWCLVADTLKHYRRRYAGDPEDAARLTSVGESAPPASIDPTELAALAAVCSLLMNLDETVTKE